MSLSSYPMAEPLEEAIFYRDLVDIVFVIDTAEKMEPFIDTVKRFVCRFPNELRKSALIAWSKPRHICIRAKVQWFRNNIPEDMCYFGESPFFILPEEEKAFFEFVEDIRLSGCSNAQSALDALIRARNADFCRPKGWHRNIVVLFTASQWDSYISDDMLFHFYYRELNPDVCNNNLFAEPHTWVPPDIQSERFIVCAPDARPWLDLGTDLEGIVRVPIDELQENLAVELTRPNYGAGQCSM